MPRSGMPPKTRNPCQWASNSISCVCSKYARTRKTRLCDSLIWATWSFVRSPPRTAKSSLQSNWNASPGRNEKGARRCHALSSAALAADRLASHAQKPRHGRRTPQSREPQDRHASVSACDAACATWPPPSSASRPASPRKDRAYYDAPASRTAARSCLCSNTS